MTSGQCLTILRISKLEHCKVNINMDDVLENCLIMYHFEIGIIYSIRHYKQTSNVHMKQFCHIRLNVAALNHVQK